MSYCIYKHTNKINGKVYIGKSQNIKERWSRQGACYKGCTHFYNAIQKYGWNNFIHEVLEDNLTSEWADFRERYYIKLFDSRNPDKGYNIAEGGTGGGHIKGANNVLNKKIICLETKKIYPSARLAGEELGIDESCIRKVCRGERASAGGFHWENYNENKNYNNIKPPLARGVGNTRKVECIETGEIFSSCVEAAEKVGSSSSLIGRCCRGAQKSTRGLHFCYIGGE